MTILRRFLLMLQFFTTIPIKINLRINEVDFGKGLVFAPLIGTILGAILGGLYIVYSYILPVSVATALTVVSYIVLTGGIHLDGLGDTFDAVYSGRPKERMLEIMRDSRVGTNAVLAVVSIVLLDFVVLNQFKEVDMIGALICALTAGRTSALIGASFFEYAGKDGGLAEPFTKYCGIKEAVVGILAYSTVFIFFYGFMNLHILIGMIVASYAILFILSKKIGGVTGDILGATIEIIQTLCLIVICTL